MSIHNMIGTKEAAVILGITEHAVKKRIERGKIQHAKLIGPTWVIDKTKLDEGKK